MSKSEAKAIMEDVSKRNRAYQPLTEQDDTMMQRVVEYYKQHGTSNDVMEAYYLLGSVYRDLHEAPKAMEAFLNGINAADTTSEDCRYDILARLYGQESDILRKQKLHVQNIEANRMAALYAERAKDTLYAIDSYWHIIGENFACGNYDSVVDESWKILEKCKRMNRLEYAATHLNTSILACLELGRIDDAQQFMNIYEKRSGDIDSVTKESIFPIYYYAKGRLLTANNELDLAEIYFRKELTASDWNNRQAAYRGLHEVFEKTGKPDSMLKYANLQCEAVDSDYQEMLSKNLQNLRELYDYSRAQDDSYRKSLQLEKEQRKRQHMWWGICVTLASIAFLSYNLRMRYRKKVADAELELERANAEQMEMMSYIAELQKRLNETINEQKKEQIAEEIKNARKEYGNVRLVAKLMRQQYFPHPVFRKMLELIKNGEMPTTEDYDMIETTLCKNDKELMSRFYKAAPAATDFEKKVFLLRRMGMTKTEISLLTAHAKNSIITAIGRFYEKQNTRRPKCSAEADDWVLNI